MALSLKNTTIIGYTSNNNKIEIAEENNLIEESDKQDDDGVLLFFCLPNGGCYELIPKSKIDFYLVNGFSFLCWNYRGYGLSKGRVSYSNLRTSRPLFAFTSSSSSWSNSSP